MPPLQASQHFSLNVYFSQECTPTAQLVVWTHVIREGVLQSHIVLLGRSSYLRFHRHSCAILQRQPGRRSIGELTVGHEVEAGAV